MSSVFLQNMRPMKKNKEGSGKKSAMEAMGCCGVESPHNIAVQIVCRDFCKYFKGTGGKAACGGFSAVFRAMNSGRITVAQLERVLGQAPQKPERTDVLTEKLCVTCSYLEDGCDFQSSDPPEGAAPCGGYCLFQILMKNKEIMVEDI